MMTVQASKFTPEVLLSAPRRSAGVPNSKGELVLYTVSTYSFESHSKTSQIRTLSIKDGSSNLVSEDPTVSDPIWISETEIAYLKPGENGCTALIAQNVVNKNAETQKIHHFAGSISSPKAKTLSNGKVAFCCAALTTPSGDMYWPAAENKSHTTAKIYDSLFVRHWDAWVTDNQNSLWYGQLEKKDGKWTLEGSFTNLLKGTSLVCPVPPFGGAGDFDLSETGIAFVSKDPEINLARHTKSDLYYVPLKSYADAPGNPQIVQTGELVGYSASPTFSRDGKKLAFLRMKSKQYESDKNRLLLIPDINDLNRVQEFYKTADGKGGWDRKPDSILWSHDDKNFFVATEHHGRVVLWTLPSSPAEATELPKPVLEDGHVSDAYVLGNGSRLFITSTSRIESSKYSVLDLETKDLTEVSSTSKNGRSFGLHKDQMFDIWYQGSRGYENHAICMTPSNFDKSKKYPLAFLIHGGPQNAWADDWSTRWNPAIFAEQGYVVVCPNPTGSTGYGQEHVDAITENWGGSPYDDLVKCFGYVEKNLTFVDIERSVALGASYGGYMINWIQGHDLGRRFKALVCHDGVFSTISQWTTEELFFPEHDFGGTLWDNRAIYEKWDPSRFTGNWATPMLVIHNELDYRLTVAEGLAMFNVLQARQVPSKLVMFPDENHWVLKPENSLVWHREVINWINKYSGVSQ